MFAWISEQRAIISLYSIKLSGFITEAECLLRGTNWVFKSDGYSFVFKWLISVPTHQTDNCYSTRRPAHANDQTEEKAESVADYVSFQACAAVEMRFNSQIWDR